MFRIVSKKTFLTTLFKIAKFLIRNLASHIWAHTQPRLEPSPYKFEVSIHDMQWCPWSGMTMEECKAFGSLVRVLIAGC